MSRARRASRVGAAAVFAVLLGFALGGGAQADAPLTTADVQHLLRAGTSEDTILKQLSARGFAEPLDAPREGVLRLAGASETLIVAIRRVAPVAKPSPATTGPIPPRPPGSDFGGVTVNAEAKTVRIPVSVLDSAGQPVLGLEGHDFRVLEDGKPQAVSLFSGERRPLRIALALDVSRSMENKVQQVEQALSHFIDVLEPSDQILVLTFSDEVQVVQDFTSDRDQLRKVIDRLQPAGGTSLYDAVYDAIQRVAEGPAESKAVVVVTDGVDTVSAVTLGHLREEAKRDEVPVFSIGLDIPDPELQRASFPGARGPGGWGGRGGFPGGRGGWGGGRGGWGGRGGGFEPHVRTPDFDAGPLNALADDTGARALIVKGFAHGGTADEATAAHLKSAVEAIATTLRYRYLIGYEPPVGKKKDWHTIRVDVDRPGATARARKGYYSS